MKLQMPLSSHEIAAASRPRLRQTSTLKAHRSLFNHYLRRSFPVSPSVLLLVLLVLQLPPPSLAWPRFWSARQSNPVAISDPLSSLSSTTNGDDDNVGNDDDGGVDEKTLSPYYYDEDENVLFAPSALRRRRKLRRSLRTTTRINLCMADPTGLKARVCQNCAKITLTRDASASCCYDDNNAYSWCKRIYDFTNPLG